MPIAVTEIWRYPVKSMGGERLDNVAVDERGVIADRIWAVRDPELGSITTDAAALLVRRPLRGRSVGVRPGSCHRAARRRRDLERRSGGACPARAGRQRGPARADTSSFRQGCIPAAARDQGRHPRAHFGLAEDEALPQPGMYQLLQARRIDSLRHASRFACRLLSGARDHSRQPGSDGRAHAGIRLRRSPVPAQPRRRHRTGRRVCATRTAGATPTSTCRARVCTRSPRCVASCLPASSAGSRQTSK